jgi:predicted nuclease of predicted toxin-antitoxin system
VLTILLDENIDGYAEYLSRLFFSSAWGDISSALGVSFVTFAEVGLTNGTPDEQIWEFCQKQQLYLLTDNRNQEEPDSLETMIRTRSRPTSLPVFTISNINRLRSERDYLEALVAKLLEYLMDADKLKGTGRLYLP